MQRDTQSDDKMLFDLIDVPREKLTGPADREKMVTFEIFF